MDRSIFDVATRATAVANGTTLIADTASRIKNIMTSTEHMAVVKQALDAVNGVDKAMEAAASAFEAAHLTTFEALALPVVGLDYQELASPPGFISSLPDITLSPTPRLVTEPLYGSFGASSFDVLEGLTTKLSSIVPPALPDFGRLATVLASQPLTFGSPLGFAAFEVHEEFRYRRHHRTGDLFLKKHLTLSPTNDRRGALWLILRRAFEKPMAMPPPWLRTHDEGEAVTYLKAAVLKEAKRIRRDREISERSWGKLGEEPPLRFDHILLDPVTPDPTLEDPALIVARQMDDRAQILNLLLCEGTEQDQEIVGMIRAGGTVERISVT